MTLITAIDSAGDLITGDIQLSSDTAGAKRARVLQLNRPDKRNAVNTKLLESLRTEIAAAQADRSVRAVVLCGGGGTFCAGGDVKEFDGTSASRAAVLARSELLLEVASQLERSPLPTLAVITGSAAGGGAVLALACDMAVGTPDLRIGFPELRNAVVPSLVMPSAIAAFGRRLAFDLLTSGRYVDAREAIEHGVINRVAEPAGLRQVVMEVLSGWAVVDADALYETKRLISDMHTMPQCDAVRAGLEATARLWKPRDA